MTTKILAEKTLYEIKTTATFKKNIKKAIKQGKNIKKLKYVITKLANKEPLDFKYKDHNLINDKNYSDCKECHIDPDWLLVYKYIDSSLILLLIATGSHSELF